MTKTKIDLAGIGAGCRLMFFQTLRDRRALYDSLPQIVRDRDFRSAQELPNPIHCRPDAAVRKRFLEQLRQRRDGQNKICFTLVRKPATAESISRPTPRRDIVV